MSEKTSFPPVAHVDWNGPFWGDNENQPFTLQEHCSRPVQVGEAVLCVSDGRMVSWGIVDDIGQTGGVYIRHASDTCIFTDHRDNGIAYLRESPA